MKKMVILISGRGSNMEVVAEACRTRQWPAQIVAVISNRPEAAGLTFAQQRGIPTAVVDHRTFQSRDLFDQALRQVIDGYEPDLVILAGFMRVLGHDFTSAYEGRMINIHPSILPSFKGLHTHQQALDAGVAVHGATVHYVTERLDDGAILIQGVVPVLPSDNCDDLGARVLQVEHRILPQAVEWIITDQVRYDSGHLHFAESIDGTMRMCSWRNRIHSEEF